MRSWRLLAMIGVAIGGSLVAAAAPPRPVQQATKTDAAAVTAWARQTAIPLGDDARLIAALRPARLLSLGEFTHGAAEPLLLRNRLVRLLAERGRLDFVAIESGLVEGQRLNAYVMGGSGSARDVAARYLNWGFGAYPQNVALLEWLRAYNARPGVRRVAIHGIDVPGGDDRAIGNASIAAADSVAWLRRVATNRDEGLIAAFAPYADDLSLRRWFTLKPAQREELVRLAARLVAYHARHRAALAAASSPAKEAWAERTAVVLQQVIGIYRVWPTGNQAGDRPDGLAPVVAARDSAMAANTLWLLRRAGPRSRALLFMHNGHAAAGPRIETLPSFDTPTRVIGQQLRSALGRDMTVVLTNAAVGPPETKGATNGAGTFGAALAAARPGDFLVDLRRAPPSLGLDRMWPIGANMQPVAGAQTPPRAAADLVVTFAQTKDAVPAPQP